MHGMAIATVPPVHRQKIVDAHADQEQRERLLGLGLLPSGMTVIEP
jgi:hypothetical protein